MENVTDEYLRRNLAFDLYGRYAVIRDIICANRNRETPLKILDIGGRGNLMSKFLPDDDVWYLDLEIDELDKNAIKGDGCRSGLPNESFDWVVSSDVLEHIPQAKREVFVQEQLRLARKGVILAAPFNSEEVQAVEKAISASYEQLSEGKEHRWLNEHISYGLPEERWLATFLQAKDIPYQRMAHNSLLLWEFLMGLTLSIYEHNLDLVRNEYEEFNLFYNSNVAPRDYAEPSYRKIYFIKKGNGLRDFIRSEKPLDFIVLAEAMARGQKLINAIDAKHRAIGRVLLMSSCQIEEILQKNNLPKILGEKIKEARKKEIEIKLDVHKKQCEKLSKENLLKTQELAEQNKLIQKTSRTIKKLEEQMRFEKSYTAQIEVNLNEFELKLSNAQELLLEKDQYINNIKKTLSWKVLKKLFIITNPIHRLILKLHYYCGCLSAIYRERGLMRVPTEVIKFLYRTAHNKVAICPEIKKEVVFISGCPGDAMRYRCWHQSEQLAKQNILADVFEFDKIDLADLLNNYDIFVLHRVPVTDAIENAIKKGKAHDKIFIFDTDDLVFDTQFSEYYSPLKFWSKDKTEAFMEGLKRVKRTMELSDVCLCSTTKIRQELENRGKVVYVNPNCVSDEMIALSEKALKETSKDDTKVKIGYFSGSSTHEIDFKQAENSLFELLTKYDNLSLHIVGHLELSEKWRKLQSKIVRVPLVSWRNLPKEIAKVDINIAPLEKNFFCEGKSELKYLEAALLKVPTVASNIGAFKERIIDGQNGFLAQNQQEWTDKLIRLIEDKKLRERIGKTANRDVLHLNTSAVVAENLKNILSRIRRKNSLPSEVEKDLPMFSVITVLFGKEKQLDVFIEAWIEQSYQGKLELIFVDDQSPDHSIEKVQKWQDKIKNNKNFKIKLIQNKTNLGNCKSRNIGISKAQGDYVVIIDTDCIVNKDFLRAHYWGHKIGDYEVVVGYFNIETGKENPKEVLEKYENNPKILEQDSLLQDKINKASFLNCITRNFSIRKDAIVEPLFDENFSYSLDPETGFGWEDVEMGYSLYKRGLHVNFMPQALSVHMSHSSTIKDSDKSKRSLKNFRKLIEKHPELIFVARRWVLDTYEKISAWITSHGFKNIEDKAFLDNRFQRFLPSPFYIKSERKLKILTYRWHCAHQYELYKLPYEFTLLKGVGTGIAEFWEYDKRPCPANVQFKTLEEININDFDLAILHFDENVLAPENTNGRITPEMRWGDNFKWFMQNVKLPKVAICHGTPQFFGQYNAAYKRANLGEVITKEHKNLVEFIGDTLVVLNSYQAQAEWRFKNSRVIWHGFDPTEFPLSTYQKGILAMLGQALINRPHYNGYLFLQEITKNLPSEIKVEKLLVPEPQNVSDQNLYAKLKYKNYIDELRQYSVYLNPTLRSPMPRSRGEAMMCGLVSVSAANHDVELFIKNGINGFYSNDAQELREYLMYLIKYPDICAKMATESRKTATDLFNHDRYLKSWEEIITEILNG